jgi:hypothetical protein
MNTNGLATLKKSGADLVRRIGDLEHKMDGSSKVKRVASAAPAVDRLARDIHRISVEVDILEGQLL